MEQHEYNTVAEAPASAPHSPEMTEQPRTFRAGSPEETRRAGQKSRGVISSPYLPLLCCSWVTPYDASFGSSTRPWTNRHS